ncbi:MAG: hypothetical protein LW809_02880 [Vampirovibrionales bacterium]|jgi:hypothetical protein|nr:hypothetical protein [Vampirovibrionales bacterium]
MMKLNAFAPSLPVLPAVSNTHPANTARVGANTSSIFENCLYPLVPQKEGITQKKMLYLFDRVLPENANISGILKVMPNWFQLIFSKFDESETAVSVFKREVNNNKVKPRLLYHLNHTQDPRKKIITSSDLELRTEKGTYQYTEDTKGGKALLTLPQEQTFTYKTRDKPVTSTIVHTIPEQKNKVKNGICFFREKVSAASPIKITHTQPSGGFLVGTNPRTLTNLFTEVPVYSFDPTQPSETITYYASTSKDNTGKVNFPTSLESACQSFGIPNITTWSEFIEYIEGLKNKR